MTEHKHDRIDDDDAAFAEDERCRIAALQKTAPKTIWLQIDPEAKQFDGWDAQTWCTDLINDTDVEYIRKELHDQQLAAKDAELIEDTLLRERLSDILSRTAIALKGPNEKLSLHSWHDLPEKTNELQQQLACSKAREEAYRAEVVKLSGELTTKNAALHQAREEFEKIENQQVVNTTTFQIARKAIAEIDMELKA
jgi:hypothetical protein